MVKIAAAAKLPFIFINIGYLRKRHSADDYAASPTGKYK
jgi:hypothetical protein